METRKRNDHFSHIVYIFLSRKKKKKRLTLSLFLDNNWLVETWGFFFLRIPCLERKRQRSARPPNHSVESAASSCLTWSIVWSANLVSHVPLISSALVCFSSCPFSAFLSPHNFCWRSSQFIHTFLVFFFSLLPSNGHQLTHFLFLSTLNRFTDADRTD